MHKDTGLLSQHLQQHQKSTRCLPQTMATKPQCQYQKQRSVSSAKQQPVGGWLSQYSIKWTQISNSYWLNNIIKTGFKTPFQKLPPLSTTPTRIIPCSKEQATFLEQTVQESLQKSAI
ncbi:hypothetical protein BCV72DRAFT_305321 [Rhizopus microsporus var. microsporus]|uniref:Uncharacterized protein n=2 Tax=Rhizopus microsporus TaxID=58291 RepID=A0A2G4T3Z0_RHIZD|nr:uncharacterized protein RHIMIDRAFT_235048 [Rhizopus microsporus ATCC 52813]ORE06697.1 hypothetical protein BCV72DRAFT_305321 [Rhizopus microsporus var. microsporus]PHZ15709.1 hypothetical protein RHIMIDRAFT_235048 [Rhizopus microsporus ATCC 52813]